MASLGNQQAACASYIGTLSFPASSVDKPNKNWLPWRRRFWDRKTKTRSSRTGAEQLNSTAETDKQTARPRYNAL